MSQAPDGGHIAFDDPLVSELSALSGWAEEKGKVTLDGPRGVVLPSGVVQTLAMALHELTTNAVKYGAFSQQTGRLDIHWRTEVAPEDQTKWIAVDWKESGVETRQMSGEGGRIGNGRHRGLCRISSERGQPLPSKPTASVARSRFRSSLL